MTSIYLELRSNSLRRPFRASAIWPLNPGLAPWAVLLDPFGVLGFAPETSYVTPAPRQGRGEVRQPLSECVSLSLFYPGVRFAHPRLISFRPAGAEYVTVFMKSCA